MLEPVDRLRLEFFERVFGQEDGQLCIATTHKDRGKSSFKRYFFQWPTAVNELVQFIETKAKAHNVYFSTALYKRPKAEKAYACHTMIVWADLDTCAPDDVSPKPPIVLESSPGRYQALWLLEGFVAPEIAEDYSRRIAYGFQDKGVDVSGWDIGQLLRVPYTHNFKSEYQLDGGGYPTVEVVRILDLKVPDKVFEGLSPPQGNNGNGNGLIDVQEPQRLEDATVVIKRHMERIEDTHVFLAMFETVPETSDDWSKRLWRMIHMCFEAGMNDVETYTVARASACNKYARDGRPSRYLWLEVLKAANSHKIVVDMTASAQMVEMPVIYNADEGEDMRTFIDDYREYGVAVTDAPPQFHELSAVMILSSLISANLVIPVSHGDMHTNLWGLILGESTLSRKSTAMKMATEIISSIDQELMMASDGSIEGIMTTLSYRSNQVSIFFRDEVSGFFETISKRDYLSGMQEAMTQLYDVPSFWRRTLRKETITVHKPSFIFYGGGIKERVYTALQEQAITSGFLPRFLIVSGTTNLEAIAPIGPPVGEGQVLTDANRPLIQHAVHVYNTYRRMQTVKLTGQGQEQTIEQPLVVKAHLDADAWKRMQGIEYALLKTANDSSIRALMLPMMQRLSNSCLKLAALLAASRQEPTESNTIQVTDADVRAASKYIQDWGRYSIDAALNIGKGMPERQIQRVLRHIRERGTMQRSHLMRDIHLTRKQMDEIAGTLIDRGHIMLERAGKAEIYRAID